MNTLMFNPGIKELIMGQYRKEIQNSKIFDTNVYDFI